MAVSQKFIWTVAICLTVLLVYVGIIVPILIRLDIAEDIANNNPLYLNTFQTWGQVPGTRQSTITRTYYLYNVSANISNLLQGNQINYFEEIRTMPYTYNFTYQGLKYIPNTNESTQYYKQFENVYTGNETDLQNMFLRIPDIGAAKAQYVAGGISDASLVYSTLLSINQTFFNHTIPLLAVQASESMFNFSKQNVDLYLYNLSNSQIPSSIRDQIWSDPFFGLGNQIGRSYWFSIIIYYQSLGGGQYGNVASNDTNIQFLADYFNIPYDYVAPLVNWTSLLSQLAFAGVDRLCVPNHIPFNIQGYCNYNNLFEIQFQNESLTDLGLPGVPSAPNMQGLNQSFFYSPEFYQIDENVAEYFSGQTYQMFDLFSQPQSEVVDLSLFKFNLIEAALEGDSSLVMDIFPSNIAPGLGEFVVDYIQYVLNNVTFMGLGDTPETRGLRSTSLVVTQGMITLLDMMADVLLYNTTALLVEKNLTNFNCNTFFTSINASLSSICQNANYNLGTPMAMVPWIRAFIEGQYGATWQSIQNLFGINSANMQSILSTSLQLGEAISNAVFAYADAVGCDNTCNKYELAILQWANNSVIQGLVNKGYVTAPSNSVNDLFTGFCGYPEFQVYTSTLLPDTFVTGLPSFGQFSILNQYTVMNFLYNYNHQNYNYLENFYGLNQMQQEQLFKYLGYIFGNYYYGLGTCGFMTVINAYDLIWGFNESRVTEVQEGPLFGGQMYYSPLIQLGGVKENVANYNSTFANMINTGGNNLTQLRQMTAYLGNYTICLPQTMADGEPICEPPFLNANQFIYGTDGFGFSPLLDPSDSLIYFDSDVLREVEYQFNSDVLFGSDNMELYYYTLDLSTMDQSETYNVNQDGYFNLTTVLQLPIVASLPYYNSVAPEDVVNIVINGSVPSVLGNTVNTNSFLVEKLTGVTVNYTRNYLYSFELFNPFNTQGESIIVPLMAVFETYSTPDATVTSELQSYYQDMRTGNVIKFSGIILGGLVFFGTIIWFIIERKKFNNSRQSSQLRKESELEDSQLSSHVIHAGQVIKEENEED